MKKRFHHYTNAHMLGQGTHFVALETGETDWILKIPRFVSLFCGAPTRGTENTILRQLLTSLKRHRELRRIRTRIRHFLGGGSAKRHAALDAVIIPSEWRDAIDVAYIDEADSVKHYSGWAIRQMRADVFNNSTGLDTFAWPAITDKQLVLWKLGLGLGAAAETWGPKNWGRTVDGRIGLVDLSHIVTDKHIVRNLLLPTQRERREKALFASQPSRCQALVPLYIDFVASHLSVAVLERNWGMGG